MMKKRRMIRTLSLLIALLLALSACSSKSSAPGLGVYDRGDSGEGGYFSEMNNLVSEEAEDGEGGRSNLEPEKVIVNIHLNFETTEFDKAIESLTNIVGKNKAYVEYSNISYSQYYSNKGYREGDYSIRVPKAAVEAFRKDLSGLGNMISENVSKVDASKQYRDTAARLKVVEAKEERLLSLLSKAEKIEDIIALENQLTDTIYEKEQLKGGLQHIDDQVDYSSFYINILEVARLSNLETVETSFGTKLKNAIGESLSSFVDTLQELVLTIIYIIPSLLAFALIAYPIYWVFKKTRRAIKKRGGLLKKKKFEDINRPDEDSDQ